jgi:hypothetical protein
MCVVFRMFELRFFLTVIRYLKIRSIIENHYLLPCLVKSTKKVLYISDENHSIIQILYFAFNIFVFFSLNRLRCEGEH